MTKSNNPQHVYVLRHGETEWSKSGQHTGLTDLPLTNNGKKQASLLKERLNNRTFEKVFVSPLKRARDTCEIAGYLNQAEVCEDLLEWDYGDFEGLTTPEIQVTHKDWTVFNGPNPGGESLEQISARADRFWEKVRAVKGDVALFSSGHISRVLVSRWLGLGAEYGRHFTLSTATLSILAYEHCVPVIKCWNS